MADVRVTKVMALTIDDLLRLLPVLVAPNAQIKLAQNQIDLMPGLKIEIAQQQPSRIGSITMPRIQLDFCFNDWRQIEIDGFLAKFERVFHRGGG